MEAQNAIAMLGHLLEPGTLTPSVREEVRAALYRFGVSSLRLPCNPQTHADKGEAL